MMTFRPRLVAGIMLALLAATASAHGDEAPQAVDVSSLPPLGPEWQPKNPYTGNTEALRVGKSGYTQNCARCHGIEAISGGISPDLRKFDDDCMTLTDTEKRTGCLNDNQKYFFEIVQGGKTRQGRVYMPPFKDTFTQEAIWAIRTYIESRRGTE